MRRLFVFSVSTALLALAGCVAPSEPAAAPAAPVPVPAARPAPRPTPAPAPASADWRDWPLTPGNWSYRPDARGSVAAFGAAGQEPEFTVRCDRMRGRVYLARRSAPGSPSPALSIRTTSTLRQLGAARTDDAPAYPAAELAPGDSLLDAMGFSRGRFLIEGAPGRLVVPAWAEVLRVTEDCRG